MNAPLIEHAGQLARYAPPDHRGTVNVRLVEKDFCGAFEMIRGVVQPGGEAEPHAHETEHQVMYVIAGEAEVTLGEAAPEICGPGTTGTKATWRNPVYRPSRRPPPTQRSACTWTTGAGRGCPSTCAPEKPWQIK